MFEGHELEVAARDVVSFDFPTLADAVPTAILPRNLNLLKPYYCRNDLYVQRMALREVE